MKTKAEILRILEEQKPELVRRYGLKRLALFGSYAREDQHENSGELYEFEAYWVLDLHQDIHIDQTTLLGDHQRGTGRCPVGRYRSSSRISGK